MLKIKADKMGELEKFGFVKFADRIVNGYSDRGTESGYIYNTESTCFEVITSRKEWKWIGSPEINELAISPNDYDMFPGRDELSFLYDLIKANIVEEAQNG